MALRSIVRVASLGVATAFNAPSCKDDAGENVDFAYAFKYPNGYEYAYMDSTHELAKSSQTMDSEGSSITKTLDQMNGRGVSYVIWNDQPAPTGDSAAPRAHAKGLLIFTEAGGLWLTHSLPHFPSKTGNYFTDAASRYGQTFLCITIDAEQIHKISTVMDITRPVVFNTNFASGADKTFADVLVWANGDEKSGEMTASVPITSRGGQDFTFFGKAGHWGAGKDLYHDLVAPALGALDMEGWRRGAGAWGPACGKDEVLDILTVSFPGNEWKVMNDHSKWAVAQDGSAFCVGDINRMKGQDKRGGGTVCIKDSKFAGQIKKVIGSTDDCKNELLVV